MCYPQFTCGGENFHECHGTHVMLLPLQWHHNERDVVSNHRRLDCLLNRLVRRRSKKTSKFRVAGLCEGNSPVNSPHKRPVTRKMFPCDVKLSISFRTWHNGGSELFCWHFQFDESCTGLVQWSGEFQLWHQGRKDDRTLHSGEFVFVC